MDKKVAVLIPSFNSAETVGATLKSFQDQAARHNRLSAIYVADDCSSDTTVAVVEQSWTSPIPLIVLKSQENLGQWKNTNNAIKSAAAGADWILILHSDDIAKANWLDLMLTRIDVCPEQVGSICSSWDTLMPDGSVVPGEDDPSRPPEVIKATVEAVRGTLKRGCWWHISGCAIRMRAFKEVGGFDPNLPQLGDWEWLLRCLHRGWGVEYVPRTLILYRQHQQSVSSVSFLHDRDVVESLEIVRHYVQVLSKGELISLHLRGATYMVRRFVRAAIELRLQRCLRAAGIMALIWRNLFKCLQERLS